MTTNLCLTTVKVFVRQIIVPTLSAKQLIVKTSGWFFINAFEIEVHFKVDNDLLKDTFE